MDIAAPRSRSAQHRPQRVSDEGRASNQQDSMQKMQPQRWLRTAWVARRFPRQRGHGLCISQCRENSCEIDGPHAVLAIKMRLLRREIRASPRAFQLALARRYRLLVLVACFLMVFTARHKLGWCDRCSIAICTVMRMVPAASEQSMDEQQASCQIGKECVHRLL